MPDDLNGEQHSVSYEKPVMNEHPDLRQVPWSLQDIVEIGIVGFVLLVVGFLFSQGVQALLPELSPLFIYLPVFTALYVFIFLLVERLGPMRYGLERPESLRILGFRGFRYRHVPLGVATLFVAYFAEGAYAYLVRFFFGIQDANPGIQELKNVFGESSFGLAAAVLLVSIIAPIVEETVFRGFLYAGLRNYFPVSFAAAASAFIFSSFHLNPLSLVPIFILGLFLAWLYEREDSLYPCIIFHALNNTVALLVVYFYPV